MMWLRKSKKGFTLIELMVVVAIIGVLALLGLRLYATQQDKAKTSIVKANAGSVQVQIQTQVVDNPLYNATAAVLDANTVATMNLRNPFTGFGTDVAVELSAYSELSDTEILYEGMAGVFQDTTVSGAPFYICGFGKAGVPIADYILRAQR